MGVFLGRPLHVNGRKSRFGRGLNCGLVWCLGDSRTDLTDLKPKHDTDNDN